MRKIYTLLLILLILTICGCQVNNEKYSTPETKETHIYSETPFMIILRSHNELEEMRKMAVTTDQDALNEYLLQMGLSSKDEIVDFLEKYDSLPKINLIEGNLCLIMRQMGTVKARDEDGNLYDTGSVYDIMYITVESDDGDWVRTNYYLSKETGKLSEEYNEGKLGTEALAEPILVLDGRGCIYSESQDYSLAEKRDVTVWDMSVDGIHVEVVYCSDSVTPISVAAIFDKATISNEEID